MRKFTLLVFISLAGLAVSAQENYWTPVTDATGITTGKLVQRESFPKTFRLFRISGSGLRNQLFSVTDKQGRASAIISVPTAAGSIEQFEIVEASNFEPALQARFPQIRAFSGKGITDRSATLKLSYSPSGIQTMIFRSGGPNEYMEAYSADNTIYAAFAAKRKKGGMPWVCSTQDEQLAAGLNSIVNNNSTESNAGQLKTMRIAQSCTGEYAAFFGASTAGTPADQAIVLTAYNNTYTRCNGLFEKDLALHLNLVASTTSVIFYNPATDPYATVTNPLAPPASWNNSLQNTLTNNIGEANYDIGHLFGASGGGGNAGCIGCVCEDGFKGRGITSPSTGTVNSSPAFPPAGDSFDIDYVAHEIGHQLGATHTYSIFDEETGTNVEVASGITIMGYAGITPVDVAGHSIDIFSFASIEQIQDNLATRACPITTQLAGINATPVVAPQGPYIIPISTPFALTGSASDANAGDVLTYCWEQSDNVTAATQFENSIASPGKTEGPNWISFSPTTSPVRVFPRLQTILDGNSVTGPLPGGDPDVIIEALSSVGRSLNFRLTVRDNVPFNNGTGAVAQTAFTNVGVTVSSAVGPFLISSQNAPVSYPAGTTQTVTWSVNGTTGAPTNTANVAISWSSDNGVTFTPLIASTPNDGTETFIVPFPLTNQGRIKVEAIGNIYFDINNAPVTVTVPVNGFSLGTPTNGSAACSAPGPVTALLPVNFHGPYNGPVTVSYLSGAPAGTTVSISPSNFTANGNAVISLNGTGALTPGTYNITIQGTGPAPGLSHSVVVSFTITPVGPAITSQPVNTTTCAGANVSFNITAAGTFQWQESSVGNPVFTNIIGATSATLIVPGTTPPMNGNKYRCVVTSPCGSTISDVATLTVNLRVVVSAQPVSQSSCVGNGATFIVAGVSSTPISYQWQSRVGAAPGFINIPGANSATYTISAVTLAMNGSQYRCILNGSCGIATSNPASLTVFSNVSITGHPADVTVCEGSNLGFTAAASGAGVSYQWEISRAGGPFTTLIDDGIHSGTNSANLSITGVPPSFNGNRYRCIASIGVCSPGITNEALLTVNAVPAISSQPAGLSVCEGDAASFAVIATTMVGSLSYQWQLSTDGGSVWNNITGATNASFTQASVPAGQNGYRFRVIVTAGCGSTTSAGAVLTVNRKPVITFNPPYVICVSDPAFTLNALPAGGAFSGRGVSGNTFSPSVAGISTVPVVYTATVAGCQSTSSRTIRVNECAERHLTLSQLNSITVYPNPNRGTFNIRLNTDLYSKLTLKIFNSLGQAVRSEQLSGLAYGTVIPVKLSNAPAGVYHLYLSEGDTGNANMTSVKLVVYR